MPPWQRHVLALAFPALYNDLVSCRRQQYKRPQRTHWAQTPFPCYSMLRCHGRAVALERDFDRGFSSTPNEVLNVFEIVNESTTSELFGNRNQFVKFTHFLY